MERSTTQSGLFSFTTKILLLVLGILLIYQSLGTLLNILTFERISLDGLTARYRIIGSDLKNEIAGALKFGKSLEQFVGMDRMVSHLFTEHADLESVFLLNKNGKILYRSGHAGFVIAQGGAEKGDTDRRILTGNGFSNSLAALPKTFDWHEGRGVIFSQGKVFYLLFPIKPRFGDEAGVLGLTFNKKVFNEQRSRVIVNSVKLLTITLLLTLLMIGVFLYFCILRPTRRQIDASCRLLGQGLYNLQKPGRETPAEIHDLQQQVAGFAGCINTAIKEVATHVQNLRKQPIAQPQEREILNQMRIVLEDTEYENRQPRKNSGSLLRQHDISTSCEAESSASKPLYDAGKKGLSLNKRILLVILGFSVISQMCFLYVNVNAFRNGYLKIVQSNLETIGASLQERLDLVLGKGISINNLVGLKPLLQRALGEVEVLSRISIGTPDGQLLYSCTRTTFLNHPHHEVSPKRSSKQIFAVSAKHIRFPLADSSGGVIGRLILEPDQTTISNRIKDILLDSGTVILISILTIIDLLFFMVVYTVGLPVANAARDIGIAKGKGIIDYPVKRTKIDFIDQLLDRFDSVRFNLKDRWIQLQALGKSGIAGEADRLSAWKELQTSLGRLTTIPRQRPARAAILSPALIRPVIFLSVLAEALAISFLPLYARQLYHPLLGLPQQVVIGLPIAVYMFCFALTLPIAGAWTDLFGRRRLYLAGTVASAVGLGLCGLSHGIVPLILSRGMLGIGNGTIFMAAQGYILDTTSSENRAEGLAIHLTAFYSGTMCGTALGSMLADRLGYRALFFLGSIVALLAVVFLYLFVAEKERSSASVSPPEHGLGKRMQMALPSLSHIKALLADRNFTTLSLLQAMPNKVCLIGMVFFAAPILLQSEGVSQSNIGRIVAIYSLLMVLFSQVISRWSDRFKSTKQLIFWGGLLSGLAFIPFFFYSGPWVVIGAITMLGLVHTLTVSNQTKLAASLKSVERVGLGPGLGIYRQAERLGNVLATLIIGSLAAAVGFSKALAVVGVSLIVMSLLFGWLFRETNK